MRKETFGEKFATSKFFTNTEIGKNARELFTKKREFAIPKGKIVAIYVRSSIVFGKEKIVGGYVKAKKKHG